MEKPFVIANREMKERVTAAVNESMKEIPADVIADFLEKLTGELRTVAEQQFVQAQETFEKSSKSINMEDVIAECKEIEKEQKTE
jgi:L-asparaginase/Glu-tRNA(Gln) amidotransferase subunit D